MAQFLHERGDYPDLTYDDVFLVPNNPILSQLQRYMGETEMEKIVTLYEESENAFVKSENYRREHDGKINPRFAKNAAAAGKEFMHEVLMCITKHPELGEVTSRDEVDFRPLPTDIGGKKMRYGSVPLFVSNMNTSTGTRMVEAASRVGATAVLSQDATDQKIKDTAKIMREADPRYPTATTVTEDMKLTELRNILKKRDLDGKAVVINDDGTFNSIIDLKDMPARRTQDDTVERFKRADNPVTAKEGITPKKALEIMEKNHVKFLPVLNQAGEIVGALTEKNAAMSLRYKPNLNTETGGLSFAVGVAALRGSVTERVKFLIDEDVNCLVLDTAHFDQKLRGYKNLEKTRELVDASGRRILIVAGNVVTREATKRVLNAGADLAKVGIGPGSMCTTRIETAVGRPQLSAVLECADTADSLGKGIIADGGIRYPRDTVLALSAGARYVMFGSLFAGTLESPPDLEFDEKDRMYKKSSGMASRQESQKRRYDKAEREIQKVIREILGHRAEGISDARVYLKDGRESAADLIHYHMDGVTSAMTYVDANDLAELAANAIIGIQTMSGYKEGEAKFVVAS